MGAAGEAPVCDNNLEPDPTGAAADLRRLLLLWPARPGPPIIPIYMDNAVSNNAAMVARHAGVYPPLASSLIDGPAGVDQRGHIRPTYAGINFAAMVAARQGGVEISLIIDGAHRLLLAEAFQQGVMIGHSNEDLDQVFSVLRRSRPSSRIIPDDNDNVRRPSSRIIPDDDTDNDNVPDLVSDTDSDDEIPLLVD